MRVILREDLDDLGLEGDIVNVAKGYARNYLIPKNMAVLATEQNLKALETQRRKIGARRMKAREQAEELRAKLADVAITISQKAGEEGKLYGSVTGMDIADELEKQGFVIDRRKIVLEKPIKALGEFEVPVKIHPEVTAAVRVSVESQEEKKE